MPPERLQKILSNAGIASRREAEEWILEGRIMVNGQPATELGARADLDTDEVTKVTTLVGDFAGQVSVAGSGQTLVFERAAELDEFGAGLIEPDLWVVNLDGSGLRLLVEDAYAPAWSH